MPSPFSEQETSEGSALRNLTRQAEKRRCDVSAYEGHAPGQAPQDGVNGRLENQQELRSCENPAEEYFLDFKTKQKTVCGLDTDLV